MTNKAKKWLIVAASLFIIGCIIFVGVMSVMKWDFRKLSTAKFKTNTYEITENFDEIITTTLTADVVLIPSTDGRCRVVCYEESKVKHEVKTESGKLIIDVHDERRWYDHLNLFSFETPKITIYLPTDILTSLYVNGSTGDVDISPELEFNSIGISVSTGSVSCLASASGEISIEVSTGNINVSGIHAGAISIRTSTGNAAIKSAECDGDISVSVTTGDVRLTSVTCGNLFSTGGTGDIKMKNVVASGNFHIERSTGDIELERCDAAQLYMKTSTGDVEGSLLSEKIFITHTSTGDIDVPKSSTGGICEITTSTGDIEIEIR